MNQYPPTRPLQNREPELKEAFKELFPPGVPPLLRWRLAIAGMNCLFLMFMGWSVSPYGFALGADQEKLRESIVDIRVNMLEQTLFSAKDSECTSTDPAAKRFFQLRVLALGREYFGLTKTTMDIPPCRN